MNKKVLCILAIVVTLALAGGFLSHKLYKDEIERQEKLAKETEEKLLEEIKSSYHNYVITINDANLYKKENNNYQKIGTVFKDTVLNLEETVLTSKDEYFKVVGLDQDYYIHYKDVIKSENQEKNKRYLNYIKLDKEIVTKEVTRFYVDDKNVYTINKSFVFPVYIIKDDKYYVEYDGAMMYVLKDDVKEEKTTGNNQGYATEIPVIAYHFFYDPANGEVCNQVICHSKAQFTSHLDYIKNNNFFTPTMEEFELFMDGKIRLPKKSVLITIDDGWLAKLGIQMLEEYKLNGTVFLITGAYDKKWYTNEYVEAHSHTDKLHTAGVCPGGQGGGLKCLDQQTILNDLKTSSEKLDGSTVLCYPFYEYNDYTISMMKQAGYTMGFAGYYANGTLKAKVGGDKYQIPRVTMGSNSGVDYLKSIIG